MHIVNSSEVAGTTQGCASVKAAHSAKSLVQGLPLRLGTCGSKDPVVLLENCANNRVYWNISCLAEIMLRLVKTAECGGWGRICPVSYSSLRTGWAGADGQFRLSSQQRPQSHVIPQVVTAWQTNLLRTSDSFLILGWPVDFLWFAVYCEIGCYTLSLTVRICGLVKYRFEHQLTVWCINYFFLIFA